MDNNNSFEDVDLGSVELFDGIFPSNFTQSEYEVIPMVLDSPPTSVEEDPEDDLVFEDPIKYEYITYPNYPPDQPKDFTLFDCPGDLNFRVDFDKNSENSGFLYSDIITKIYTTNNFQFGMTFGVDQYPDQDLFVRATPTFSDDGEFENKVIVCAEHKEKNNIDENSHYEMMNILRCSNAQVIYCGDRQKFSRLNLLFPLNRPHRTVGNTKEFFNFLCRSSCSGGMCRRAIKLVFSLENQVGEVLGQRVIAIKIGANPKRDIVAEELKARQKPCKSVGSVKPKRAQKRRRYSEDEKPLQMLKAHLTAVIGDEELENEVLQYLCDRLSTKILERREDGDDEITSYHLLWTSIRASLHKK